MEKVGIDTVRRFVVPDLFDRDESCWYRQGARKPDETLKQGL